MDLGIAMTADPGDIFVGRLMAIEGSVMSCITCVPIREELVNAVIPRLPPRGGGREIDEFQHQRCAIAVYRAAIELGWMRRCMSIDVSKELPTEHSAAA